MKIEQIAEKSSQNKKSQTIKCIVWDLDNTLWGGVIGEDGIEGIRLSHKSAGAGFMAFQQTLRDLYDRGIILAINSRNNPDDALKLRICLPHAALRSGWDLLPAENCTPSASREHSSSLQAIGFDLCLRPSSRQFSALSAFPQ